MISATRFASAILSDLNAVEALATDVQAGRRFSRTQVRKRDGSTRELAKPDLYLSMALKKATEVLRSSPYIAPDHVHGFVRGRSIVTNARPHLDKACVTRVDLERFFESTTAKRVETSLNKLGFSPEAASLSTRLFTIDDHLPVGFSTSPFLSNLVFAETDTALAELAKEHSLSFTRYADDLVFSGALIDNLPDLVEAVVQGHGWRVNHKKTRVMKRGAKQFVTGLSVSDPKYPRIPLQLKRQMRWKIHYIERFGYDLYMTKFMGEDANDHPRRLLGYARYIAGVEPAVGLDLLNRLNAQLDDSWYHKEDDAFWEGWLEEFI